MRVLACKVPQAPNRRAVLKVYRQFAKIQASHALVGFDIESVRFVLAESQQTFLAKDIETESFSPVIKRFGGNDKKESHGFIPCSG